MEMLDSISFFSKHSMYLHSALSKTFKNISDHAVAGSKAAGFNPTSFAVMEVLYQKGPQPIQQIGAKLLLQSGNVTYIIDKLENKGYLSRHPCPQDRRIIYAGLTEEGQKKMAEIYPAYIAQIDKAYSGINNEEMHQLITLLNKLSQSAESLSVPAQE